MEFKFYFRLAGKWRQFIFFQVPAIIRNVYDSMIIILAYNLYRNNLYQIRNKMGIAIFIYIKSDVLILNMFYGLNWNKWNTLLLIAKYIIAESTLKHCIVK